MHFYFSLSVRAVLEWMGQDEETIRIKISLGWPLRTDCFFIYSNGIEDMGSFLPKQLFDGVVAEKGTPSDYIG